MDNIEKILKSEYTNHKTFIFAETFTFEDGQGVIIFDLGKNPSKAKILAKNNETNRLMSYEVYSASASVTDAKQEIFKSVTDVLNKKIDLINSDTVSELSAQEAIKGFGLGGNPIEFAHYSVDSFLNKVSSKEGSNIVNYIDRNALVAQEETRLNKVVDLFRNIHISEDALNALRVCDKFKWSSYYFYSEESENGKLRRQAAEIYPMFAEVMSKNSVFVRRTIQRKKSLNEGLSKLLGISEKTLKKFQGKDWNNNGIDVRRLAIASDEVPIDWFPKDQKEWEAFSILTDTVRYYLADEYKPIVKNPSEILYKGSKGKWEEFHQRCALSYVDTRPPEGTPTDKGDMYKKIDGKQILKLNEENPDKALEYIKSEVHKIGIPDGVYEQDIIDWVHSLHVPNMSKDYLQNACKDAQDMIQFINEHIILPSAGQAVLEKGSLSDVFIGYEQRAEGRQAATKILFAPSEESGKAAPAVLSDVRKFHSQLPVILENILPDTEKAKANALMEVAEDGWPPMTDEVFAPNGLLIKPLTDPRELKEEGKSLNHCVGGYSNTCRDRGHHILSIRRMDGHHVEKLSTFEVLPFERGDMVLNIRQHRGKRNGNPVPEAIDAYEWYLNEIEGGRILLNYDRIMEFRTSEEVKDDIERICSYDWRKKEEVTNAMMAVGPYVHKSITKTVRNIDDFISHEALQDVTQSMDPTVKFQVA